jgi:hypothetical protein
MKFLKKLLVVKINCKKAQNFLSLFFLKIKIVSYALIFYFILFFGLLKLFVTLKRKMKTNLSPK